ncbi:MAG: D-alanyl-D-alanine carboxypeptidase/D-alanyl-D-alanine-endopeptidase, partial [Phycisphaerales bacterium]|nr:D-alanyl-D-alanine carboxypeptidase/D-alanyl-D-alanine-endopeptidase [Phycisphaerales bacterium]
LVGDGDPTIGDPTFLDDLTYRDPNGQLHNLDEEAILAYWVDGVEQTKMTNVRRLILDDLIFDAQRVHPTWPRDQLNRQYCAEVAGINFHGNTVEFHPKPGSSGRPDWSSHRPWAAWLVQEAENKSANATSKQKHTPWIAGKAGSDTFQFRGHVKSASQVPVIVTVEDPALFMGRLLADRLADAGTSVGAIHRASRMTPPGLGEVVGPRIRTPISTVIQQCNEDSDNLYAEALLKRTVHAETGRPGSWSEADAVFKAIANQRMGGRADHLLDGVVIADGSGLSRSNRVSAAFLTAWLDAIESDPKIGEMFVASLALGGVEGTLGNRFSQQLAGGAVVEAKSGYINGVSCLSGYVTMPDGHRYAFSVLVNNISGTVRPAKKLQEQVVQSIARRFGS